MVNLSAKTKLNLVVGHPIAHTLSPFIHQKLYQLLGINHVLLALDNPSLLQLINIIRTMSVSMTAITMPFKTSILEYVDTQSDAVKALGSANTLLFKDGIIHAENTDVDGILTALGNTDVMHKNVLIIGAGGTAKAVAYALHTFKPHFFWMNRTQSHAHSMQNDWGGTVLTDVNVNQKSFDVIINTTSVGMHPHQSSNPLPEFPFDSHHTVFDVIYNPCETELLKKAKSSGASCISGIHMFIAQALKQIELFTDKTLDTAHLTSYLMKIIEDDHELHSH